MKATACGALTIIPIENNDIIVANTNTPYIDFIPLLIAREILTWVVIVNRIRKYLLFMWISDNY